MPTPPGYVHQEANPYNGKVLVQRHGTQEVWVNPPPIPLETDEMDWVFDLPYQRKPHPSYAARLASRPTT